jgi:ethanolamine utilization protein EutN
MTLGRVIGRVWATVKNREMEGCRLLLVQPLTADLKPTGRRIVVGDNLGAGAGELVYWVGGKEASFPFHPAEPPFDRAIVGIVDSVHVELPEAAPAPAAAAPTVPVKRKGRK